MFVCPTILFLLGALFPNVLRDTPHVEQAEKLLSVFPVLLQAPS